MQGVWGWDWGQGRGWGVAPGLYYGVGGVRFERNGFIGPCVKVGFIDPCVEVGFIDPCVEVGFIDPCVEVGRPAIYRLGLRSVMGLGLGSGENI